MSTYSSSSKRQLATWLDNAGQLLNLPRLEGEDLFSYKGRLIDHVRNKGNTSVEGLGKSLARVVGLERTHILTLTPAVDNLKPYIEVTSKYIRLFKNGTLDLEIDIYASTLEVAALQIDTASTGFTVSYLDEDFTSVSCKKIMYGHNKKAKQHTLNLSKANILPDGYLDSCSLTSEAHVRSKASLAAVVKTGDFYIDYEDGLVYTGTEATGYASYVYYEVPFKLFYSPVTFFPLNDQDINEVIKDPVLTSDGLSYEILNSKGSSFVNELLAKAPIHWGR
jgi:hypothetical protein